MPLGICGSCSMNIDGLNTLACIWLVQFLFWLLGKYFSLFLSCFKSTIIVLISVLSFSEASITSKKSFVF